MSWAGVPAPARAQIYFNNDAAGHAANDAITYAELAEIAALSPTRVPSKAAA
ncbi:MAG TPA: hypothetical protein VNF26_03975 [Candidatus Baltobacterales bacterium]|nr:hypothetical protein [Candidatus Baltobacterales bacterium]